MKLKKLYEDENIVAIDKPEGIASIPESNPLIESIFSILQKEYLKKIFIVHRLDKEVSGVLLFAKNSDTHKFLYEQFFNYTVDKTYIALVEGVVIEDFGTIDKPIRQFGSGKMGIDELKGKKSITYFKVLERFSNYTLLELKPKTGRRHQIRVHLYSIGHPVVGDLHYGDIIRQKKFSRLMLHAHKLEFFVREGKKLLIESKLPNSFNEIINRLAN
ncbi:MAG: RNA pseudouridine synthase [Melioribacter sp.]|nr:RNA pseudouridine synthase [Melioribacter sp.]